jgi:hydrogenase maturation protease
VNGFWEELAATPPESVPVGDVVLRRGSRVRLRPRAGGDVLDIAVAGRTAIVESLEQDAEGTIRLAVTVEDDPGRDLGESRQPGHRFFFTTEEVEPLADAPAPGARVLVAGIGNVFLGDDGFGVAVARRLATRTLPPGVVVKDFGIRGLDLAYALQDDWDAAIFVDAAPRGGVPGALYAIDAQADADGVPMLDEHGMDPVHVLRLARTLGRVPPVVRVVGCEPATLGGGDPATDVLVELSPVVAAAVAPAADMVLEVIEELTRTEGDRR